MNLSTNEKIGIAVGGAAVLGLVAYFIFSKWKAKTDQNTLPNSNSETTSNEDTTQEQIPDLNVGNLEVGKLYWVPGRPEVYVIASPSTKFWIADPQQRNEILADLGLGNAGQQPTTIEELAKYTNVAQYKQWSR